MAEINQQAEKYLRNPLPYARKMKRWLKRNFPEVRVLIFGSAARGDYQPDSDIDILVISPDMPGDLLSQAKIKVGLKKKFPEAPFQIHLATPEEYENWYRNFIKQDFHEV